MKKLNKIMSKAEVEEFAHKYSVTRSARERCILLKGLTRLDEKGFDQFNEIILQEAARIEAALFLRK